MEGADFSECSHISINQSINKPISHSVRPFIHPATRLIIDLTVINQSTQLCLITYICALITPGYCLTHSLYTPYAFHHLSIRLS